MQPLEKSRRSLLRNVACGFGSLALGGISTANSLGNSLGNSNVAGDLRFSDNDIASIPPNTLIPPKAKRIIFIFMQGGPSQVDSFDPKPALDKYDKTKVEFLNARTRKRSKENIFKSPWKFKKHGECGQDVSELFPHMANCVDDFCLIKSMHTEGVAHGPSTLFLHTGATNLIRPSIGSWVTYGLGTENQDLPSFVTINPPPTKGGPRNYGNAFLPPNIKPL